jgi:diguanylate cyclase (GGDEF)-like protein
LPVELLAGILLGSVAVNAALIFWLSRSRQIKLHWPRRVTGAFDSSRSRPPTDDISTLPRRRSLFVAERPDRRTPVYAPAAAQIGYSALSEPYALSEPGLPASRSPVSQTLPPDLADFLSRPATIAPGAEGSGVARFDGMDRRAGGSSPAENDLGSGVMARVGLPQAALTAGMTLDALTGLEGPASWSRIIEIENARLLRYRRPVTIVMIEVEGLRRLAERLGDDPVDRLLPVIADALHRQARATDWVARIGDGRFAAFLPETDEIQAINYVERIRLVCEPWLASAAVPLWLAIGWSGPTASSDLEFAILRAEERMNSDRRMPGRSVQLPRVVPTRVVSVSRNGATSGDEAEDDDSAVSPAETGRSGEWIGSVGRPEGPLGEQAADASRGTGPRKAPRTASVPERRNEG